MKALVLWADETSPNLGVRALMDGTAAMIKRVFPEAHVDGQSYGHGPAPKNIGVPRTLLRERFLDSGGLRTWMKSYDLVVDTRAGDSFADIYGLPRLRQQSAFAEFVRQCGVPLVMGPQTLGPFDTPQGRRIGQWSLKRADAVLARDHISEQHAAELGRPVDALTTDVVFALPVPNSEPTADVVFNVSGLLWESDAHGSAEDYHRVVDSVIRGFQERGRTVTLLAHVLDSSFPDKDTPTVLKLAEQYGLEAKVPNGLQDVRSFLSGANLVVGSRMHACLNAMSVGTPALPLAYSRKFAPLMADLGWDHVVSLAADDPAGELLTLVDTVDDLDAQTAAMVERAHGLLGRGEDVIRNVVAQRS